MTDRRHASLLPIFLIVLVDVLGMTIVLPLLPVYAESFGASAFLAALLVPTYSVCQLLSGPALGRWSDQVGRRKVLLVSQAGTLLGFLMIASAQWLWLLFAGRILDGLTAGNLTVAQAYIADNTEAKNRTKAFALIGIAFGIGFLLGPAITGYLSHYGMSAPLYLAAALSLLSIVCTATLLPADPGKTETSSAERPGGERLRVLDWGNYAAYFKRPVLGPVLGEFFLYQTAFSMFLVGFALFAERRYALDGVPFTPREIGYLFAFSGFMGIIIQGGILRRLNGRVSERQWIGLGLVAIACSYAAFGYAEPGPGLYAVLAAGAFGNAVLRPAFTSIVTQIVPKQEQGTALGLTQTLASLGSICAAPLSGWLLERHYLTAWGWVAGGLAVAALVLRRWGSARHSAPVST